MKRLLAFLALCLPLYLLAQGFGSFSHDQPYMAKDSTSGEPVFPGVQPEFLYWWHAADISSNDPVAVWNDRMAGYTIIQTNTVYQPTNTTDGVCFDGTKSLTISPTLLIPTNCSVFISGYLSQMPHSQVILISTNNPVGNFSQIQGLLLSPTNQLMVKYSSTNFSQAPLGNNTNLVNIGYTTKWVGPYTEIVSYTNGVLASSNIFSGQGVSFDSIGGAERFNGDVGWLDLSLYAHLKDIMIWTNATLNASNMVWLNNWSVYTNAPTKTPFFNPASIAGMFEWWRADQPLIGFTSGGGGHTNGMSATYAPESYNLTDDPAFKWNGGIAPNAPVWMSSAGTSGRAAIGRNGAYKLTQDSYGADIAQPTVWFSVIQCTNTSGSANQLLFDSANSAGSRQLNNVSASAASMQLYAGSTATFPYPYTITNTTIVTSCFNGANSWVRTNGVSAGTVSGSAGANPFHHGTILGNEASGANPFLGYLYELMGYSFASMTTNDIAAIENSLKLKYGIP